MNGGDDTRNLGAAHRNGNNHHHSAKRPKISLPISESEIREEFSHHEEGVARINNGSFGSCPASVQSAQKNWQLRFLRQPDDFYHNTLSEGVLHSRTIIKGLINADDVEEISLVDNATTAAAIVLQQVGRGFAESRFNPGDSVVMLHCAFQAVKKSIQAYVTRAGGSVVEVELPFPVTSKEEVIDAFRLGLRRGKQDGKTYRLAIIDHITSMPSVVLPVKDLVSICREEGVERVFVDAAHAIGSVKIDVKEIGAEFYVSNLHKWFFCPPSVAFLYCKKFELSKDMRHPVAFQEHGNDLPVGNAWTGTRDYSSQLVVHSAMEFVERFEGGLEGIMARNQRDVVEMGKMLADSWGTNLGSPPEMCASMVMVGLPSRLLITSGDDALRLRSYLRVNYGVEVPIHYQAQSQREEGDGPRDKDGGRITGYARISHQVYNVADDYYKFRDAINELLKKEFTCRMIFTE
ncbi:hypothetical protein SAY87_027203 [Trapa incisa]|uniref:Aminotransferase class V domain-containing protein n=1 Tax=Trapa incisa TaxID=236973 RepID=A0AAN7JLK6_9MYRT|nr:hypothetical protein SAY87_027203 [Trapa incisa]